MKDQRVTSVEKRMTWVPGWLFVGAGLAVALGLAGALVCVHVGTEELISPPRRSLQDYHHEWLNQQAAHGIRVERVDCMDGRVPCLVASPGENEACSKRGKIIRDQLASFQVRPAPFGTVCGNLILLHGRHGRKEDLLPIAERFCAVGFRCVMPDLPGHGESGIPTVQFGSDPLEASLAATVLHECGRQLAFEASPAGIWGISMGGAYAISSVCRDPGEWCSMVIVSSFDTLNGVVEEQGKARAGFLGSLLTAAVRENARRKTGLDTGSVRPVEWARRIQAPVLLVHGTTDPLIQMDRGRALFEAFASQEKKWLEVEGGNHGNVLITPLPLYATMASWFLQHFPNNAL